MEELGGFTCVNPDCDIVYTVDPGDCVCGATRFLRIGEAPLPEEQAATAATEVVAATGVCGRADCGQTLPPGAGSCPYCGTPVSTDEPSPGLPVAPGGVARPVLVAADGTRIALHEGEEVVLGRSPEESPWARLAEGSPGVSRRHAIVSLWRGDLHVRDLGSSNGTWVNGIRIDGAAQLPVADGTRIGLGQRFELIVRQP